MSDIPQGLRTAYQNKTLIPLVGAGVSMSLLNQNGERIFPSWKELLSRAAITLIDEKKPELAQAIQGVLPVGGYQQAADYARKGLTGSLWDKFFKVNFSIKKNDIDLHSLKLPQSIWKLSSRIITLNYDRVLRFACPMPDDLIELDNTKLNALADFKRDSLGAPGVWHLHGSLDNLDKIIFTSESYNKLYFDKDSNYRAAIETFKAICSHANLLFVGCGLDDAELIQQLEQEYKFFAGNIGPHYALVPARDFPQIQEKLKHVNIELISFPDFGYPLIEKIEQIIVSPPSNELDNNKLVPAPRQKTNVKQHQTSKTQKKAAVLVANPIGTNFQQVHLLSEIRSLKLESVYFPLNTQSLNELDGFDYIIIVTQIVKGKVIIEDEFLTPKNIRLIELEQSIGNTQTDAVFLFLNHDKENELERSEIESLTLPTIIFSKIEKEELSLLAFKIFKKKEYDYFSGTTVVNRSLISTTELSGNPINAKLKTPLPDLIDPKTTQNYIGRRVDLEQICRQIIELQHKNELLTIKGSGGIGKTITAKKIAVALSERNLFSDGIDFIDCEFIKDYPTFEKKVAANFGLENALEIKAQIKENEWKRKKLIILDNFEPLLYLDDEQEIKDFTNFICDYATLVITSREVLKLDCEQVYELRAFTTDEAFELFCHQLRPRIIEPIEQRYVRENILETLLGNNPLAIKLIANNIPKGKSFAGLSRELEENFFQKFNVSELSDFEGVSDTNIERRKSLYASINFSYSYLEENEKMAFELLSLFPDGIEMENLKRISAQRKSNLRKSSRTTMKSQHGKIITDSVIKALEDKSMTQVDRSIIKLQSVIGRFAEYKLSKRNTIELAYLYHNATEYNLSIAESLAQIIDENEYKASKLFNMMQGNFFKSVSYLKKSKFDDATLLNYLDDVADLTVPTASSSTLSRVMTTEASMFNEPLSKKCYEAILCYAQYHAGQFKEVASKIKDIIPLEEITSSTDSTFIDQTIASNALSIYRLEGDELADLKYRVKNRRRMRNSAYPSSLFKIGVIDIELLKTCDNNFFTLDAKYALGQLEISEVETYLSTLFEKDHLGLMETHYLKSKLGVVDKQQVRKLAHVNPFTYGLQQLIYAATETQQNKKIEFFEQSLSNLEHIKYYYVEALLFYSRYLKSIDHVLFDNVHARGLELACRHHYRWLRYNFEELTEKHERPYSPDNYPLEEPLDLAEYIRFHTKENKKRRPAQRWPQ
jgi:hypothetical protein